MCHVCHKVARKMNSCASCKQAQFCSRECQKAGWKVHKPECLLMASLIAESPAVDRASQHIMMMKMFRVVLRVRLQLVHLALKGVLRMVFALPLLWTACESQLLAPLFPIIDSGVRSSVANMSCLGLRRLNRTGASRNSTEFSISV